MIVYIIYIIPLLLLQITSLDFQILIQFFLWLSQLYKSQTLISRFPKGLVFATIHQFGVKRLLREGYLLQQSTKYGSLSGYITWVYDGVGVISLEM